MMPEDAPWEAAGSVLVRMCVTSIIAQNGGTVNGGDEKVKDERPTRG